MSLYTGLAFFIVICSGFYLFCKKKYSYWKNKGVKGPTPLPIVGNFLKAFLQKEALYNSVQDIYFSYTNEKLIGVYRGFEPAIIIRDPELIKNVLIKDSYLFQDRGVSTTTGALTDNLFASNGEKWKIMRQKLTPVFTSKKLKDMVPVIQQCVQRFIEYVDHLVDNNIEHELKALTSKYTLEVIGSCAFGLDLNTFTDEENVFNHMATCIFTRNWITRAIVVLDMIIPGLIYQIETRKDIRDFFVNLVHKVIEDRKEKPSDRKDFMDLMIEMREEGKLTRKLEHGVSEIEINDYMIACQAFVFYAAGFETSAATMSFLLYELAINSDIQERTYKDICQAMEKYNGEINYDSIKEMNYLEMVVSETLRKYTVVGVLFRKAMSSYTFPGTNVTIPKGMTVMISASGSTKNPEYFPNPQKFNPDNFLPENIQRRPPCVHLPFGEGPRNCIGMRFAKVQSMLGTATFLKNFKVEPSAKTELELKFNPKTVVIQSINGLWIKISRRK
ncbi:hypothetical protein ACJJTC_018817 [Scirpophaga incertulas]